MAGDERRMPAGRSRTGRSPAARSAPANELEQVPERIPAQVPAWHAAAGRRAAAPACRVTAQSDVGCRHKAEAPAGRVKLCGPTDLLIPAGGAHATLLTLQRSERLVFASSAPCSGLSPEQVDIAARNGRDKRQRRFDADGRGTGWAVRGQRAKAVAKPRSALAEGKPPGSKAQRRWQTHRHRGTARFGAGTSGRLVDINKSRTSDVQLVCSHQSRGWQRLQRALLTTAFGAGCPCPVTLPSA